MSNGRASAVPSRWRRLPGRLPWFAVGLTCCFALAALPAARPACSFEVRTITPAELIDASDYIVVASVKSVESVGDGMRAATATVIERWKDDPGSEIRFRSSGTWACDVSGAKIGETAILFLDREPGRELLAIAHSGRGRLPILDIDGTQWVNPISGGVTWPRDTLRMSDVRAIVRESSGHVAITDMSSGRRGESVVLHVDVDDGSPFLSQLHDLAIERFPDGSWINYGPDSSYREIVFSSRGRKVVLQSWHPIMETNPGLVAASFGVIALEGQTREEFLRKDDQQYVKKRQAFDEIEARLRKQFGS